MQGQWQLSQTFRSALTDNVTPPIIMALMKFDPLINRVFSLLKEIPESQVSGYLSILNWRYGFTSKTVLRKYEDIPEKHQEALTVISYVGCSLSAVGLSLTILTIVLSR